MRFKSILLLLSAASLAILPSCHKKDEDSESDPFLNGTVSFSIPSFVKVGEQLTVTPKGAVNPTGDVGYYWSSTWNSTRDTVKTESGSGDGTWTMTVPLATGVYTVTVGAFAANYSSISSYTRPALVLWIQGIMGYITSLPQVIRSGCRTTFIIPVPEYLIRIAWRWIP